MIRFALLFLLAASAALAQYKTENVILVTADGVRWQEVFRGIDQEFRVREEAGMGKGLDEVRRRFDGATREERRAKLMPFLWNVVAEKGVLLGDRDSGSEVRVRNKRRFSYPGYAEILTGRPHDDTIDSNDLRPSPAPTVLEIVRRELKLRREEVALFASWETFQGIGASRADAIFINAGYQALSSGQWSERLAELSAWQFDLPTPWRSARHDAVTVELALEYFRTVKPRLLYVALDETDDWAHDKRYDRVLEMTNYADRALRRLWDAAQADPRYRGKTTLIVTVDHGRGSKLSDWSSHGAKVEGAEAIWIAAIGPDTPARGAAKPRQPRTQSDVAPTILELFGLDYRLLENVAGAPLPEVTGR